MSTITVAAADLRRALDQVLRAAATDPAAGVLRGVRFEANGAVLRLVATDKRRLAVSELPILDGDGTGLGAVLEAAPLGELPHGAAHAEVVVLTIRGRRASVSVGGRTVDVAVLGGDFPDHRALLDRITADAGDVQLLADRTAVVDALEEQPDDETLRVQLKPNALEVGQLVPIVVDATYDGPGVSLFVEPTYLHDAVVAAPGPLLALQAIDEASPVLVRTPGDDSYLAVVMPVRIATPRSVRPGR